MNQIHRPVRLGVLGLGRAFTLMLPTLISDQRIEVVAGYDPRDSAREQLATDFGAKAHHSAQALCADPDVEWVYVATPHQMHAEHVLLAAQHGKSVLVEKPLALSLEDCQAMIDACAQARVHLMVGHSHSFNTPVLTAKKMIDDGVYGAVKMIHAWYYTDFMYRPRRPEELDTRLGGGVVFSQAAHQVDVVRLLGGGQVLSVYGCTGQWDQDRKTEGAYSALLTFDRGLFASITYNGYGGYDSDADMNWRGELGGAKSPDAHQMTRQRYSQCTDEAMEAQRKADRNFGGPDYVPAGVSGAQTFQHFGPVLITCERADLRLTPYGVDVFSLDGKVTCHPECSAITRVEVIDEIWSVAREGGQVLHSGEWALATLEVCLGILESAQTSMPILMHHQIQTP